MSVNADWSRATQSWPAQSAAEEMQLVRRVANGDRRAFEDLYRRHHAPLTRFLAGLLGKPELVEEVLNATMMILWRSPDSFHGGSKLSTWLFTIAHRKALRARNRWDVPVEDPLRDERPSEEAGPHDQLDGAARRNVLLDALNALSRDHRTIVELTSFHDLGYKEIAEIVGCPVETVKSRMFYARRYLKTALAGSLADWL